MPASSAHLASLEEQASVRQAYYDQLSYELGLQLQSDDVITTVPRGQNVEAPPFLEAEIEPQASSEQDIASSGHVVFAAPETPGNAVISGAKLSRTDTVIVCELDSPDSSVALTITSYSLPLLS